MRAEDLIFWLDRLNDRTTDAGVLCLRHADTMVVPRNWTLDDLRDPELHLFRPPIAAADRHRTRSRRGSATADDTIEQLALGVDDTVVATTVADVAVAAADDVHPDAGHLDAGHPDAGHLDAETPPPADAEPWTPSFDADDDLDGLLSARSPLLARAFRGDDRPRR
jgi:hypothetical protein